MARAASSISRTYQANYSVNDWTQGIQGLCKASISVTCMYIIGFYNNLTCIILYLCIGFLGNIHQFLEGPHKLPEGIPGIRLWRRPRLTTACCRSQLEDGCRWRRDAIERLVMVGGVPKELSYFITWLRVYEGCNSIVIGC
jgi:hypothetical protein